ncbi:unnamed protein product [Rotaria sp. Silwood2]|nr:unnamed protein product [Rotaria sp. Silwood2]CAF2548057.1 unnamed protein product [Rotaria sp. Silwood2]CAF4321194.1 unnamed protein product [Rotaria sp. Silwood2]CAF4567370.1 unnamed protein product [Rotaria sp. Silwood2]
MAQSIRTRVLRMPKKEQEIHVITNLSDHNDSMTAPLMPPSSNSVNSSTTSSDTRPRLVDDDFQAPLTAKYLRPNSRWFVVRHKLHNIRSMDHEEHRVVQGTSSLYLGLQMKRELKRVQEAIKNIDKEQNFHIIKKFSLSDGGKEKRYDTSHVKPNDALIYDRLGDEPLALQNLLFYFEKQDILPGSVDWTFLNEVLHVLKIKRKRTVLVQRLGKVALALATIFYIIIGFMFLLLIISFISTATKMDDPEVKWMKPTVGESSRRVFSL